MGRESVWLSSLNSTDSVHVELDSVHVEYVCSNVGLFGNCHYLCPKRGQNLSTRWLCTLIIHDLHAIVGLNC